MLNLNFTPFPVLTTPRLVLRELKLADAEAIYQLRSDPSVNQYLDRPACTGITDAEKFIGKIKNLVNNNDGVYWAITLYGSDTLIGTMCLWDFKMDTATAEIGYELLPYMQGQGLIAEVAIKVIDYCFNSMNVKTIVACSTADNQRSIAVLERLGFKLTNLINEDTPLILCYSLNR